MGKAGISLILLFTLFLSSHATDVRYCDGKADYEVKVHGVEISPNPVARGKPATFSITASTEKAILGGKLDIDVAYFGWHVYSETHDLCTETSCPVSSDFVISHSQLLPVFTPPGSYSLTMKILDATNKHQLSCIVFDFSIGFGSSIAAS